eukprot:TRINITY_DN56611_c0_g1_i1.p1 TRINITY_DN56611_c0_g1~~TRINITY_DN56611_c0_g1_i1.p1  ORF type:complete len:411 (+),score=55.63 TRINITY_DN56611_c0_g1_i1:80-1312(+)
MSVLWGWLKRGRVLEEDEGLNAPSHPKEDEQLAIDENVAAGFAEFFRGSIGSRHVFGHFETSEKTETPHHPSGGFLQRLPKEARCDNIVLRATVWRTSSSQRRSTIEFRLDGYGLQYFRDGKQANDWIPLQDVRQVRGDIQKVPTMLWTGKGQNRGWILSDGPFGERKAKFASSYNTSTAFDYCNGNELHGDEMVVLCYKLESQNSIGVCSPMDSVAVATEPPLATGVGAARSLVAWVSVDPRTGEISPYPSPISTKIEMAWQRNEESVMLGADFFDATVHLRVWGFLPFQRTKSGRRDVRRVVASNVNEEIVLFIKGEPGNVSFTTEFASESTQLGVILSESCFVHSSHLDVDPIANLPAHFDKRDHAVAPVLPPECAKAELLSCCKTVVLKASPATEDTVASICKVSV